MAQIAATYVLRSSKVKDTSAYTWEATQVKLMLCSIYKYFSNLNLVIAGEQPHTCQYCQRTFICKDSLQKHLVSHSSDRRFQCGICSRLFKRASHIREHLRTHSDNKHFFCKICGRGFKWQVNISCGIFNCFLCLHLVCS